MEILGWLVNRGGKEHFRTRLARTLSPPHLFQAAQDSMGQDA
jgi:hypothetical protein